ncbi:MAG: hypothetical protein IH838_05595 [Proteobacteria bacterium]|nr:hypothetical protein [Pseudomonadota bacterium]
MLTHDPIAPVIFGVTGILICAILGRYLARKIGQPSDLPAPEIIVPAEALPMTSKAA